MTTKKNI